MNHDDQIAEVMCLIDNALREGSERGYDGGILVWSMAIMLVYAIYNEANQGDEKRLFESLIPFQVDHLEKLILMGIKPMGSA
jgi:hypothetical protein